MHPGLSLVPLVEPCTVVSSVKGLEHVLQIFPQGIYNRDILCLESESIEIGPISGVFEQFVYLGILNACGSKTPFRTGFPSSLTTCETGSWGRSSLSHAAVG